MILFGLSALALLGIVICMLLPACLHPKPLKADDSAQQNVKIARARLAELEATERADDALAQSRTDVELALLDDLGNDTRESTTMTSSPKKLNKSWIALLVLLIPLFSMGLYLKLGNPSALMSAHTNTEIGTMPSLAAMVAQLEAKLEANPDDAEGWAMAGRTYMVLKQFAKAEHAYQTLQQLRGDDADVLVAWADATLMASGQFTPAVMTRIEHALRLSPTHRNALWLAAVGAEAREEYQHALNYSQQLLPLLAAPEDATRRVEVTEFIETMQQRLRDAK